LQIIVSRLHEYMNALDQRGYFQGAVLVGHQGERLLCRGYGMANEEHGVINTPQTKFRIGSLTKGFTAIAILQLEERGLLSTEENIGRYLPDFPNGNRMTIHHLLTHTSGIPDFAGFPEYWTRIMRLPSSLDETIRLFRDLPLEFTPGEQFRYSNSSYILLTRIIEEVSGESYTDFIRNNILVPLDMNDTGVDDGRKIIKGMASGYSVWKEKIRAEYIDMSIPQGAFGMYATVEDLYRWDQALLTEQLVSSSTLRKMFTPYRENYGYGWVIQPLTIAGKPRKCISHYGDINGFCGNMLRLVDDGWTVIVLSNLSLTPVTQVGKTLLRIALGETVSVPDTVQTIDWLEEEITSIVGTYRLDYSDENLQITTEGDQLYLIVTKMHGAPYCYPIRLISKTNERIQCITEYVDEELIFDLRGNPVRLTYTDMNDQKRKFDRMV
jgi:CubicO group peptidase (beta-lactamase class C family)